MPRPAQLSRCTACTPFSNLCSRPAPGMPGRARSIHHMRGLPTSTPQQQAEADLGLLLMGRSAEMAAFVADVAAMRGAAPTPTLEHLLPAAPPPSHLCCAWCLVGRAEEFLGRGRASALELNVCIWSIVESDKAGELLAGPAYAQRALPMLATCLAAPYVLLCRRCFASPRSSLFVLVWGSLLRRLSCSSPSCPYSVCREVRFRGIRWGQNTNPTVDLPLSARRRRLVDLA